ncbi:uncharacterized protein L203_103845 [Cryptococcus depauperatus CBS 7841]|uniref:NUP160 C-terminal TPR domain-containing protein n=1 Tax=Cryptococcus depauperatus CBS 7841 TaxID=1295531 RepID=A0AAJ8JUF4_9TREE
MVSLSPQETIDIFVQRGMYDDAQTAASSLQVDMTGFFTNLATRWVELWRLQENTTDVPAAAFLQTSPVTSRLQGSPAALASHYIRVALQRHDSSKTNYIYSEIVADTLFELNNDINQGWVMPAWLVQSEMQRNPEGWIGRALKWGWISEALDWTLELLRQATPPGLLPKGQSLTTFIPYNLIDRLIAAAEEDASEGDEAIGRKVEMLKEEVSKRIKGLHSL